MPIDIYPLALSKGSISGFIHRPKTVEDCRVPRISLGENMMTVDVSIKSGKCTDYEVNETGKETGTEMCGNCQSSTRQSTRSVSRSIRHASVGLVSAATPFPTFFISEGLCLFHGPASDNEQPPSQTHVPPKSFGKFSAGICSNNLPL